MADARGGLRFRGGFHGGGLAGGGWQNRAHWQVRNGRWSSGGDDRGRSWRHGGNWHSGVTGDWNGRGWPSGSCRHGCQGGNWQHTRGWQIGQWHGDSSLRDSFPRRGWSHTSDRYWKQIGKWQKTDWRSIDRQQRRGGWRNWNSDGFATAGHGGRGIRWNKPGNHLEAWPQSGKWPDRNRPSREWREGYNWQRNSSWNSVGSPGAGWNGTGSHRYWVAP